MSGDPLGPRDVALPSYVSVPLYPVDRESGSSRRGRSSLEALVEDLRREDKVPGTVSRPTTRT